MANVPALHARADLHNGMFIDSNVVEIYTVYGMEETMREAIAIWRAQNKKAIWIRVDLVHSRWIPFLAELGFKYHHAREEYVMMLKWLPINEVNNIPMYAHTLIGIMAVVVNDRNEVLVVTEKFIDQPHWTLPTALSEPEENFPDVAIREVYEQTGVAAEYKSVISFAYGLGARYCCSYMYCVMHLRCTCMNHMRIGEGQAIVDCRWYPIREYLLDENIANIDRWYVQKYVDSRNTNVIIDAKYGIHEQLRAPYAVYHVMHLTQEGGDGASGGSNIPGP